MSAIFREELDEKKLQELFSSDEKCYEFLAGLKWNEGFICRKCGMIEDFTEALPVSFKMIEAQTGFQPEGTRFEYYGYCKVCRRTRKQ